MTIMKISKSEDGLTYFIKSEGFSYGDFNKAGEYFPGSWNIPKHGSVFSKFPKICKMGLYLKNALNWPLNMGRDFEAWAAHLRPNLPENSPW